MNRREFGKTALYGTLGAAALGLSSCKRSGGDYEGDKVVVLGFDGMDPELVRKLVARGELPHIAKLVNFNMGRITLGTSTPPQSPVAWADFITGANPGVHGIFDFIQRDPKSYAPYFSISETFEAKRVMSLGKWRLPLKPGGVRLLRRGTPFWKPLEDAGIPCTIFRVPSNFPPEESSARTVSGLGTPDLHGGYGSFTFFTDDTSMDTSELTGGTVQFVSLHNGLAKCEITGPPNAFTEGAPDITIPFKVYCDRGNNTARIDIQGQTVVLRTGEWSRWVRLAFENIPHLASSRGMVHFFLKSVKSRFRLYASPLNIDPLDPAMPISTPADYSAQLARETGLFTTLGIPEDTKALDHGILTDGEYLAQAQRFHNEHRRVFFHELNRLKGGLLYSYFSDTDLGSHMFWSSLDPEHPQHEKRDPAHRDAVYDYYRGLDRVVGRTTEHLGPKDTLIIVSDHGFAPFYYSMHMNTWLRDNGYLGAINDDPEAEFFENVDWGATKAYACGFNGLYVNQAGREGAGTVNSGLDRELLLAQLTKELLEYRDPDTGYNPVSSVYRAEDVYSGDNMKYAPDLVIGYNARYRGSWETALGKIPEKQISLNEQKWSGDHCMDPAVVPGTVLCNRAVKKENPQLRDIPATILARFGIKTPSYMQGRTIL